MTRRRIHLVILIGATLGPVALVHPLPRAQAPAAREAPGQTQFAARCGFCHGRDAAGGESGPDLTRSTLVAEDVRGDKIGALLRSGRVDKGMPSFTLSETDTAAIVAFVHDAKTAAESASGGRRTVDAADLQTGSADAGKQYFARLGIPVSPGGEWLGQSCLPCLGPRKSSC